VNFTEASGNNRDNNYKSTFRYENMVTTSPSKSVSNSSITSSNSTLFINSRRIEAPQNDMKNQVSATPLTTTSDLHYQLVGLSVRNAFMLVEIRDLAGSNRLIRLTSTPYILY